MQAATVDIKNIPDENIVKIEKLSNLGYGIAKIDGYVVFIQDVCPEDVVKIQIIKKNKNFANAKVVELIEPSSHRVAPKCPMQKVCGACQLQFIEYDYQLKIKKEIVKDAMKSILGEDVEINNVIPSPDIYNYRHKIQYPIGQTQNSKRILAGYYKPSSHELVNIKYCPIQPEYCDEIIDFIRNNAQELNISGYNEKSHKGLLRHVVIRASKQTGKFLVTLVINSRDLKDNIIKLAQKIYTGLENIDGITVNFNSKKTNLILGNKSQLIIGNDFVEESLCDKIFKIGEKTFFQVNPLSADNIFRYVKKYISENYTEPIILDAYAGITAFGICLSDIAKKVISVEEVKPSVELAKTLIEENNIKNVELHNDDAAIFFERELKSGLKQYDISVVDPPRKGCTKGSLDYLLKLTKKQIIYVSCNPATLARDLKYLKENGCKIESIQPFDMFPHTYHIENVAIITL